MKVYITTTIPYVNGSPHIGFALELAQADALCRYYRRRGDEVLLQTGSDDNAFKNVISARNRGVGVTDFVDRNSAEFQELSQLLGISYDNFIRTSRPGHRRGVQRFWRRLNPDDLYWQDYAGLYCFGCEDFLQEKELVDGLCPEHRTAPAAIAERNCFFRLSKYQSQLERLIADDVIAIKPERCKNEVLAFIRGGLRDISVSRSAERVANWGIHVPGHSDQIIYVWIDALINYISGLGDDDSENFCKYWNRDTLKIHVIGKNVWKFHAVYWPALLLSAGLPLPDRIFVHGFLTVNGRKIGKSLGNGIDPAAVIRDYGAEAVRYYLLEAVQPFNDCDFSVANLIAVYNSHLANGIGNLCSRLKVLGEKSGCRYFPKPVLSVSDFSYDGSVENFRFDEALDRIRGEVAAVNRDIESEKPWELLKNEDFSRLHRLLSGWYDRLDMIVGQLTPFLPRCAARISALNGCVTPQSPGELFPRLKL
ncbi:MAG: methionine--tRNA ligase [Victivallaceae bacterium]|nr:methionine--tRNA ligase [Victivallaceae bacterium]